MKRLYRYIRNNVYFALLFSMHRRSAAVIAAWQLFLLRRLLRHAKAHVPLYASLLAHNRPITTLKDIEQLPITTKDTFIGHPTEEYTDNSRKAVSRWKKTSGTSGRPLTVLVGSLGMNSLFCDFTMFRFLWTNHGGLSGLTNSRIARIDVRARPQSNLLFISMEDFRNNPDESIRQIVKFKPKVLATYTSILLDITRILSERVHRPTFQVPYIVSIGEMLSPSARTLFQDVFKGEVYDRYGMGEVTGAVAIECAQHDGMHINSESVIVEIVDTDGHTVPMGASGRILVTDLMNTNMPFIRYDTGDSGHFFTEPCPCGLHTPRLRLVGRYSAYLSFAGKRINHLEFDGALDGMMNFVIQYLIVKKSEDHVVVRIIPGPTFNDAAHRKAQEAIEKIVGSGVAVEVELVSKIAPTPRGKSKIVLDESATAALA